jgi:hypothetical protein
MRRLISALAAVSAAVGLGACVGDTDNATGVRATQARLNAHGHTNNGPARWWWEYSSSQATVKNGQGTKTPVVGPASTAADVNLSQLVTGLKPATTYWFRACGMDTSSSSPNCGKLLSFQTTKADSSVRTEARPSGSYDAVVFSAAAGTKQSALSVSTTKLAGGAIRYRLEDPASADRSTGTSIATSGTTCQSVAGRAVDDAVDCTPSDREIDLQLGDLDDTATVQGPGSGHFIYVDCGPGNDTLVIDQSKGFDNYAWTNCETVSGG